MNSVSALVISASFAISCKEYFFTKTGPSGRVFRLLAAGKPLQWRLPVFPAWY
jgi:hypothetical protein